ncbi:zinc-binding dehydrogenase [Nocardioides sp. YIM 123512]|uniref:Zinc-binding dehydrogenase n=1 Tax=Nocardioides flavescens TaxID=2691959 RepID=A0A6L7EXT6_9ACTN|nr:zinc-binding dehydrogenase [Nocardioides flavescens]MXG90348.1 zinc-binding dehydrogenase [Nocardioides flavescens]
MRAVSCQDRTLSVVELPDPVPARGQLVLDVLRCGICGSDLHAREHCDGLADVLEELGYEHFMRTSSATVMGHEFVGEVVERGRGVRREFREGAHVVSFPLVRRGREGHPVGLSPLAPGGYAERVLVEQSMSFVVPNGLAPEVAALTEPMAVALHAVNEARLSRRDTAIVLGCGPVGLAVICWLKARGVRTVVASDLSAGRRALAERCGADVVVDPTERSPYDAAGRRFVTTAPDLFRYGLDAMDKLRLVPGWHHVFRAADRLGAAQPGGPVVFECVGVPGMIDSVVTAAPMATRVVVVGVCMGTDAFRPSMGINKQVDLRFVAYYSPLEFRDTLHALADGTVDASPLVTGTVGLDGVEAAFAALGDPDRHAKVLIDPRSAVDSL